MSPIKTIGVLAHPLRPHTFPVAERICDMVEQQGLRAWLRTEWQASDVEEVIADTDLVVAIGGDGAMFRAARVCAPHEVPVLGVNMGQLGFLTEIPGPEALDEALNALMAGDYWIENRMMLRTDVIRDGQILITDHALNDVVVSSSMVGRLVELETYIDGHWTTTYRADALVIATATGSTAYALACGGPILPPELKNILVVPAAPHLSMERPIVLADGARVLVRPNPAGRNEVLANVDGITLGDLKPGDTVEVGASDLVTRFLRIRERNYFYRSLLDRLEPRITPTGSHGLDPMPSVASADD